MPFVLVMLSAAALCLLSFGCAKPNSQQNVPKPVALSVDLPNSRMTTSTEVPGLVLARNKDSGEVVKKLRLYRVVYNPLKSRAPQKVWITDFFRAGDDLWLRNGRGRIFKILLKGWFVSRADYVSQEEFEEMRKSALKNGAR